MIYCSVPSVKNLHIYGIRVFVRVSESKRKSKWDSKVALGVLSGYTDVGYRTLQKKAIKCVEFIDKEDIEEEIIKYKTKQLTGSDIAESIENQDKGNDDIESTPRKLRREIRPPNRYGNPYIYENRCYTNTSITLEEAMAPAEANYWKEVMAKEIDSLQ